MFYSFLKQIRSSQPGVPPTSFSSVFSTSGGNTSAASTSGALGSGAIPQTLDQLLERQWEQGSQFLMEQAQHFDSKCGIRKKTCLNLHGFDEDHALFSIFRNKCHRKKLHATLYVILLSYLKFVISMVYCLYGIILLWL